MQNDTQTIETTVQASDVPAIDTQAAEAARIATEAAQAKLAKAAANRAKRAVKPAPASDNGKAAAKRVQSKPVPAKPTTEARERAQREQNDARRLAREAAGLAVAAFYSGASRPFKSASDRFADINTANAKSATTRQAALALALITYGAGNMRPDGTFIRGAFVVPARLVNPSAKPGETVRAQPESGCLGNMLGRACDFISGPTSGREQSSAVYRLRVKAVLAEIQSAFGDKQRAAAEKLLASFAKPKPEKRTAA